MACAAASVLPPREIEAILSRSGGLSGIAETVTISSIKGEPRAYFQTSKNSRSRKIDLPGATLNTTLAALESLAVAPPEIPPETGGVPRICGDVILKHLEVRRGGEIHSAQEECPHRTIASEVYWQRVDSVFQLLASKAL
jgi:hypothetical protein